MERRFLPPETASADLLTDSLFRHYNLCVAAAAVYRRGCSVVLYSILDRQVDRTV